VRHLRLGRLIVRYLHDSDEEYWHNPERLERLAHPDNFMEPGANPRVVELLRSVRATYFALGDVADDATPVATLAKMPPEYALPYHSHTCDIFMIVIKGSLYVPEAILSPGDVLEAKAGEFYGPEVAGPDGCTRIEFFAHLSGNASLMYKRPNGEVGIQRGLEGDSFPKQLQGTSQMLELIRQVRAARRTQAS
jgi:hypothetical protein